MICSLVALRKEVMFSWGILEQPTLFVRPQVPGLHHKLPFFCFHFANCILGLVHILNGCLLLGVNRIPELTFQYTTLDKQLSTGAALSTAD
jgi:hypothetical protein